MHTANSLTYFKFFFKRKYSRFQKIYFSIDFLNTKIIFLTSWILQHVYKFQKVLANIPKNKKILFLGIHFYSLLMFG